MCVHGDHVACGLSRLWVHCCAVWCLFLCIWCASRLRLHRSLLFQVIVFVWVVAIVGAMLCGGVLVLAHFVVHKRFDCIWQFSFKVIMVYVD